MVEFCGFGHDEPTDASGVIPLPQYMLVRLHNKRICIPGLPPDTVAIEPLRFRYSPGKGRNVTLRQFPVVLAYAITDYKCQGQTYSCALVDLKKPMTGYSPPTSLYVQFSRVHNLQGISIVRLFDINELSIPLCEDLLEELRWQQSKYEETNIHYRSMIYASRLVEGR
jgi:hypothetical protein